jgi:hypothetical protein
MVHPLGNISGPIPFDMVALCPKVAAKLGWYSDPHHLFTYLDSHDKVVAQTLYWRDGGVRCQESDNGLFSVGYVLVVIDEKAREIAPFLKADRVAIAWRFTIENSGSACEFSYASRSLRSHS